MNSETPHQPKGLWSKILRIAITVLTALATAFGVQACQ